MAIVSSRSPFHQSARVGRTVQSPLVRTCRLDAAQPLAEIVAILNRFQPEVLVAYASMIRILADEQLAGRLALRPAIVNSSSEVLTPETRARVTRAWGVPPFEVYAATETGGIAAECQRHRGMHLFEDLVIPEVVDADGGPVPPGATGARLLVTVLFSRTLPLIRYELTDRVRLATWSCYREMIQQAFTPLPVWEVPFFDREVVGLPMLGKMAAVLRGRVQLGLRQRATDEGAPRGVRRRGVLLRWPQPVRRRPEIRFAGHRCTSSETDRRPPAKKAVLTLASSGCSPIPRPASSSGCTPTGSRSAASNGEGDQRVVR